MLELRNLTKIYKTKGGDVKALDDISVTFESTGLVFLLGKSGSGKSTLLNVAGGLDCPTSGEVIVMGRSSKDFSGSDFDSYRNTYVGFVFQEYNVLSEFNVEDNVALALELQGKKKNKREIDAILGEVELGELAKRRPNTLSGGQKQRIAIARALVKDPQIIMADEPTGALDSATGKQVFETLKKLAQRRLVIVVSHDREFAEIYGDRIIELKDGKIISDVTKVHEEAETISKNVTRHGGTLTVKGGSTDAATVNAIMDFLKESDGEVLISKDGADIASFKRAVRIDESGFRERFEPSPHPAPYEGEKAKFIRSRLPASKALRIGASSLRFKPFRLVMTIILSTVAFLMFGLFSTMMLYDGKAVLANSFLASEYEYLTVGKVYTTRVTNTHSFFGDYNYTTSARITDEEIASHGDDAFGAYSLGGLTPSNAEIVRTYADFYQPALYRAAVLPENHPLVSDMVGTYPVLPDQIAVSEYFAECMENATFTRLNDEGEETEVIEIHSAEDLIGEKINLRGFTFEITGVFGHSALFEKYRPLKENDSNWILRMMYQMYLSEGLPSLVLVSESFTDIFSQLLVSGGYTPSQILFDYAKYSFEFGYGVSSYNTLWEDEVKIFDGNAPYEITFFDDDRTTLEDGEFIIPLYYLSYYYEANYPDLYEEFEKDYSVWADGYVVVNVGGGGDFIFTEVRDATPEEIETAKNRTLAFIQEHPMTNWTVAEQDKKAVPVNVLGIYTVPKNVIWGGVFCSEEFYERVGGYPGPTYETNYVPEENAKYSTMFVPMERSESALKAQLASFGTFDERDVAFTLSNVLYENVELVNAIVATLKVVFLWIGIVLAAFASLLLFNFITVSISNKKKEIGILRAVGARGTDVFKIFFSESGIIVGICTIVSVIGSAILVSLLNTVLRVQAGLDVTLFVFGPFSVLIMIGVAVLVAFVSTFLPVYFAAKKAPVESIRSL